MFVTLALSWLLAAPIQRQEAPPIELAFSANELSVYEQPALSPDGRFVVYAIHTPPAAGGGRGLAAGERFLPSGAPVSAVGVRLWVTELATGSSRALAPEGSSSLRPGWSPDSKRIAFYCDSGGALRLWIYDLAAGNAKQVGDSPVRAHIWGGDEPQWSPDGREILLGIAPPAAEGPKVGIASKGDASAPKVYVCSPWQIPDDDPNHTPLGAAFARENACSLALVNAETGAARVVVPLTAKPAPSSGRLSPSGKRIAYVGIFRPKGEKGIGVLQDLVVCDAKTGAVEFTDAGLEPDEDPKIPPFRWHPTEDRIVWVRGLRAYDVDFSRPAPPAPAVSGATAKTPGAAAPPGKREPRPLAHALGDVDARLLAFTHDGATLVFGIRMLGEDPDSRLGTRNLAIVPLNGDPLQQYSAPEPWRLRDLLQATRATLWQPEPGRVRAVGRDVATGEPAILSIDLATGTTAPLKRGRFSFAGVGATQDPAGYVAAYQSATTPLDLYQFSAGLADPKAITRVEPRFAGLSLGSVESFTTQVIGADGKLRPAVTTVVLPPGAKVGDRLPAVCFVYGGARLAPLGERFGGGDAATVPVSVFTSRGYVALLPDCLIGPAGQKGNPVQELRDVLIPQILHAGELGYVDPERVALIGQSYGGYCTAALLSATPIFAAGVSVSGLYDLPGLFAWADERGTDFHARWSEGGQGRMGGTPWEELDRYVANSPYYRADKIRTPLLMIHGESDDTCPVSDAQKMFGALKRLGSKAQLAVYPGEGHVVSEWSREHAVDAAQRILRFLGKELRGE